MDARPGIGSRVALIQDRFVWRPIALWTRPPSCCDAATEVVRQREEIRLPAVRSGASEALATKPEERRRMSRNPTTHKDLPGCDREFCRARRPFGTWTADWPGTCFLGPAGKNRRTLVPWLDKPRKWGRLNVPRRRGLLTRAGRPYPAGAGWSQERTSNGRVASLAMTLLSAADDLAMMRRRQPRPNPTVPP